MRDFRNHEKIENLEKKLKYPESFKNEKALKFLKSFTDFNLL